MCSKPFPGGLSQQQKKSWAELQAQSLSPFQSGDRYYYSSSAGLHLWVTQERFDGLPETASQQTLEDGQHIISGEYYQYQQTWDNDVMVECVTLPDEKGLTEVENKIVTKNPGQ